ncbi:hypothetical protein BABINDRAFT_6020 [Babjeviella inositovora NRRL Y-12698]|uniref:Genetic interactor of prohibitin 5, mitochondrial n=1 Tax=Babjeviella inositovora NRRL Y-12698 TaxID=984486 RepID=A0A1E3QZQ9_9ASCO|nr:uncharacterized protein BABINDRAFT_6020 [Babjeviella inositovora NRRL Y-12698]ODQ83163.1 hypothetical protein BABINDRAFT_6020 [Babjeviella inositovora NRRL Y-12698]
MSYPIRAFRTIVRKTSQLPLDHKAVSYLRKYAKHSFKQPLTKRNFEAIDTHTTLLDRALRLDVSPLETLIELAYKQGAKPDNYRDRPPWLKHFTSTRVGSTDVDDLVYRWPQIHLAERHSKSQEYQKTYRTSLEAQKRDFQQRYAFSIHNIEALVLSESFNISSDTACPPPTTIPLTEPSVVESPLVRLDISQIEALYKLVCHTTSLITHYKKALLPFQAEVPPHQLGHPVANVRIKNITARKIEALQAFFNNDFMNMSLENLRHLEALVKTEQNYKLFNMERYIKQGNSLFPAERLLRKIKNRYTGFTRKQYAFGEVLGEDSRAQKTNELVLPSVVMWKLNKEQEM